MGPCHSSKNLGAKKKGFDIKINVPVNPDGFKPESLQCENSFLLQNSQLQKILGEKQVVERFESLLSSDISFKLRSGISFKSILNANKSLSEGLTDYIMIELAIKIYKRIKEEENYIKDYHRYLQNIKQFIEIFIMILEPAFGKLENEKIMIIANKNFPFIILSNTVTIFHALIFHKNVLLVKPEDRWWTQNKNEENLQSLMSLIIEISGKIKYEYEPKFKHHPKNSLLMSSKIYSINSHEEVMQKSPESKNEKSKKEADSFFFGSSSHLNEKNLNQEDINITTLKKLKSVENLAAKYRTFDEIVEDVGDFEGIHDEGNLDIHNARDCQKYLFVSNIKTKINHAI